MKKKQKKNQKKPRKEIKKPGLFILPVEIRKWILGIIIFIIAIIVSLSFFNLAGPAGKALISGLTFLIGKATFIIPLILVLSGLVFLRTRYEKYLGPAILAIFIEILGIVGILESLNPGGKQGGWLGYIFSFPFLRFFGTLATEIIFSGVILVGSLIFWHLIREPRLKEIGKIEEKPSLIKQIFAPKFKVKEIEPRIKEVSPKAEPVLELKSKPIASALVESQYKTPPLELLETDKGRASAGDTITNSAIIKKTLENFVIFFSSNYLN